MDKIEKVKFLKCDEKSFNLYLLDMCKCMYVLRKTKFEIGQMICLIETKQGLTSTSERHLNFTITGISLDHEVKEFRGLIELKVSRIRPKLEAFASSYEND